MENLPKFIPGSLAAPLGSSGPALLQVGDLGTWAHCLPFGYVKIAIENGHKNSGFSH